MVIVVARAGQTSATVSFNVIECCTANIALDVGEGLLICIHTLKHTATMAVGFSHEVSIVLPGPVWRAAGLGWDHEQTGSARHVAQSTEYAMIR